jgi:hypothetical protein
MKAGLCSVHFWRTREEHEAFHLKGADYSLEEKPGGEIEQNSTLTV